MIALRAAQRTRPVQGEVGRTDPFALEALPAEGLARHAVADDAVHPVARRVRHDGAPETPSEVPRRGHIPMPRNHGDIAFRPIEEADDRAGRLEV